MPALPAGIPIMAASSGAIGPRRISGRLLTPRDQSQAPPHRHPMAAGERPYVTPEQ